MKEVKKCKRTRLQGFDYTGPYRYLITICTDEREAHFTNPGVVAEVLAVLRDTADATFIVWAYCFMPEHLHLLVEGTGENSEARRFIGSFKQESGRCFAKKYGKRLWQPNYYDRVLRREECTERVANYILGNPVRRGLVGDAKDYPYSGAIIGDSYASGAEQM